MPTQTCTAESNSATAQGFATIDVFTEAYLGVRNPSRIKPRLSIALSSHSYLPRVDDLPSDWVAHVAAPAFKLYRRQQGGVPVDSFCSIGTGSGLDVLSASELLGARRVGLTDVHEDVVATAADNIARNHQPGQPLVIEAGYGDLLAPLRRFNNRYALIYENLPNVPLPNSADLATERKSSTHVPPRTEELPELVRNQMLDLHYLALWQAKDFLLPGGAVLSTLGARVPLEVFLALGKLAGYSSSFLTYTWKVQADPNEVIRDHAQKEKEGFGPFHFYRADVLEKTFASVDLGTSGAKALEIERSLQSARLDATSAYELLLRGERIGHTVAVLQSELK
jgi:methylase of polypeptide subunit release factors